MFFAALLLIAFCLLIGYMPSDLTKLLLGIAWAGMALMAAGSMLYSVCLLLF